MQTADRGIGGTGIIGVITGFASICVAGQEVGYEPALPVLVDGRPGVPTDLRAGQLVLVDAAGPDAALRASRVAIRHEVVGPVQSSFAAGSGDGPGSRLLRVAGQRVAVSTATLGETAPPVGAWVAVSGFRDPDGIIRATRIDRQPRGEALIAGTLLAEGGHLRIGTAEIVPAPGQVLLQGREVVVVGRWSDGVLHVVTGGPDLLGVAPAAFFDAGVGTLVIESYAGLNEGRLVLGRVQQRADGQPFRRSIVEFARRADGALQPASVREIGPGARGFDRTGAPAAAAAPSRRFEPAPVPQRGTSAASRGGAQNGGRTGNRAGDDRSRGGGSSRGGDVDPVSSPPPFGAGGFGGPGFGSPGLSGPGGRSGR